MSATIERLTASEILDSRGKPTVAVTLELAEGIRVEAAVPSGASTSINEAVELRDNVPRRYNGQGVLRAVANVNETIASALKGKSVLDQAEIDQFLIDLDGTENKSKLGANAILGVSMAVARAAAKASGVPLFRYLGGERANLLPVPMLNVINGGKHAPNNLEFQEFMIVPHGAPTFAEALRYGAETYDALKKLLSDAGLSVSVGDEGGFAPNLAKDEDACEAIVRAIEMAGYKPGVDISIALDPAASSFFSEETQTYLAPSFGKPQLTNDDLRAVYRDWCDRYPIVLIEDGFAETCWTAFQQQTKELGDRIFVMGDDLYSTNPKYLKRGIDEQATNYSLIKLNQIGTVTETIRAIEMCRSTGWGYMISHRSGETTDSFIADFAVAMRGGMIKSGAPCRGERVAKYNRLAEIERELGKDAEFRNLFVKQGRRGGVPGR
jgi:enolase